MENYQKGRGAQINPPNKFNKLVYEDVSEDFVDEDLEELDDKTEYTEIEPKTIVNKVESPDIGDVYSLNPYQGCEHGCIYCYARNSHEYLGYSAGLDFEKKILVKINADKLLRESFSKKNWNPKLLMLSGNTDCYQPIERKYKITRKILQVCLEFEHPVGIITKNSLILRDLDLLIELAKKNLLRVNVSINSMDSDLKSVLEPRTASAIKRFQVVKKLTDNGIPVNVLIAPVIPGLNSHEILNIIKLSSDAGAYGANYIVVRLNGKLGQLFADWLERNYPNRKQKVYNQIKAYHQGKVNDNRFGIRMKGEGKFAQTIQQMYKIGMNKYFREPKWVELDFKAFERRKNPQLSIF